MDDLDTIIGYVLAVLGAVGFVLQRLGRVREAKMLNAVIEGVEAFDDKNLKATLRNYAEDARVGLALHRRVKELTAIDGLDADEEPPLRKPPLLPLWLLFCGIFLVGCCSHPETLARLDLYAAQFEAIAAGDEADITSDVPLAAADVFRATAFELGGPPPPPETQARLDAAMAAQLHEGTSNR